MAEYINRPLVDPPQCKWYVHVWVRGHYAGCNEYETELQARGVAMQNYELFRACGCYYRVSFDPRNPDEAIERTTTKIGHGGKRES